PSFFSNCIGSPKTWADGSEVDEDCAKEGEMPVAAKPLMVSAVNSAARALDKIPEHHHFRTGLPTEDLQESSVLRRGFTSDRAGDDIYNVDMVRIDAACKIRMCLPSNHNDLAGTPRNM